MSTGRYRAVLTGATGGIGQQFALALAPECSAMLLVGRDSEKLAALRQCLQTAHPDLRVEMVAADLGDEAGRERVLQVAKAFPGGVNLLINNAGISDFHAFSGQANTAFHSDETRCRTVWS